MSDQKKVQYNEWMNERMDGMKEWMDWWKTEWMNGSKKGMYGCMNGKIDG